MKIEVSQEEMQGLDNAALRGAAEGLGVGFALALPANYVAQRYWSVYRNLPIQGKAFAMLHIVGIAFFIQTERRTVQFDEEYNWKGVTRDIVHKQRGARDKELEGLTGLSHAKQWAINNQYKVILGAWATSMALASAIIFRNRHQSTSQKVVQARMWAQGLTVGILISAGILTHSQREEAAKHHTEDHSWRDIIEAEEREKAQRKIAPLESAVTAV